METNNLLKEINNKVSYLECLDFYKDISKVTDINYFWFLHKSCGNLNKL